MSAFAALLRRDWRRTRRSPTGTLLLLLFPIALGTVFSFAFGGSSTPRVRLLLALEDDGLLGRLLSGAAADERFDERFQVSVVDSTEGRRLLDRDQASALLVLPKDFTQSVLDGTPTTISVWKNPRESILPQVVEEGAILLADALGAASRLFAGPLETIRGAVAQGGNLDAALIASAAAGITESLNGASRFLFPPVVQLETKTDGGSNDTPGLVFLLIFPGFVVMTIVMIADFTMRDLLRDATRGTLALTMTSPTSAGTVVRAKIAFTILLGLFCLTILSAFGAPFLKTPVDPAAFLALSVALCAAAGGFVALTYGLAKSERQGAVVGSMVLLVMSFLGGSYIPLQALPPGMRALSPFTLNYWGVDGFAKILGDGAGVAGIAPHLAVLTAIFVLGSWSGSSLLERRFRRGAR